MNVLKRDGSVEPYDTGKVVLSVTKAYKDFDLKVDKDVLTDVMYIHSFLDKTKPVPSTRIMEEVEKILMDFAPYKVARNYIKMNIIKELKK